MAPVPEVDRRLALLREAAEAFTPPAELDALIAARAAAPAPMPRRPDASPRHWVAWPLALAATLAVVSFIVRALLPGTVPAPVMDTQATDAPFNALVPLAELQRVDDARVVPARVPRMTLAQWGVPVDPARAAEPVDAQLLVRRDGALLAWRVVP